MQALRRPILAPLVGSSRAAARSFATEVPETPSAEKPASNPHVADVAAADDLTAHLPPNVSFQDLGPKKPTKQDVLARGGEYDSGRESVA